MLHCPSIIVCNMFHSAVLLLLFYVCDCEGFSLNSHNDSFCRNNNIAFIKFRGNNGQRTMLFIVPSALLSQQHMDRLSRTKRMVQENPWCLTLIGPKRRFQFRWSFRRFPVKEIDTRVCGMWDNNNKKVYWIVEYFGPRKGGFAISLDERISSGRLLLLPSAVTRFWWWW